MSILKKNDLVAIVRFAKVTDTDTRGQRVTVVDVDDKTEFDVNGKSMIDTLKTASLFTKPQKVTMTRAAEILSTSFNTPFTVAFTKQDGTERVLRGRLLSTEPLLGRSNCEDLDIASGHRLRLVDHRTIKWIIVGGEKYEVK
jgi:hypothetical protein